MSDLQAVERDKYETLWAMPKYGDHAPGGDMVGVFTEMSGARKGDRVLDAGCGSGRGALALQDAGYRVLMCDLTPAGVEVASPAVQAIPFCTACLWHDLKPQLTYLGLGGRIDWAYCCDVMEHIPPAFTMLVVDQLLRITRKGVFLSINLQPDVLGALVGVPLHQSLQSFVEWRSQLSTVGRLVEARDWLGSAMYLVAPR